MDMTPIGAKFFEDASPACDSDMFFIKGFKDWSPDPRCGNLTGYSSTSYKAMLSTFNYSIPFHSFLLL